MAKQLNTRMRQKADTNANWEKATSFVPLAGEIILYTDLRRFKVGDGSTTVNNLPWYGEIYADQAAKDSNGLNIAATYLTQTAASNTYVKKAGDTMTGALINTASVQTPKYYINDTTKYMHYDSTSDCIEFVFVE